MNTYDKVQAINDQLENQGYNDDMIYTFDEDTYKLAEALINIRLGIGKTNRVNTFKSK